MIRVGRVFAYGAPTDMRKGFDGLTALVANELRRDVVSGDAYLFVARNRKRARILFWDGTGLCVFSKRLEQGCFVAVWARGKGALELTHEELARFIEGSQLEGAIPFTPFASMPP